MRKVLQPRSFLDLSTSPNMWSPTYSTSLGWIVRRGEERRGEVGRKEVEVRRREVRRGEMGRRGELTCPWHQSTY